MRLPFWASVLTLCGVAILLLLGWWQLQRLAWKQGLLDAVQQEYAVDAERVSLMENSLRAEDFVRRGFVEGVFLHDKSVHIQSRTFDGVVGTHLVTPLLLVDGGAVMIDRGWVPLDGAGAVYAPQGQVKVLGMLRHMPRDNQFVPQNNFADDLWFRFDPFEIAHAKEVARVWPSVLYAEDELALVQEERLEGAYPVFVADQILPKNNHAQYAMFWFFMAVAMVGVYVFRFIVPQLCSKS